MNNWIGILIILGIIFVGMYGGTMNKDGGIFKIEPLIQPATINPGDPNSNSAPINPTEIVNPGQTAGNLINSASGPTPTVVDPTKSKYSDLVYISYVTRSTDPNNEYVQIQTRGNASTTIQITGWSLKSESTGQSVTIPKGTYLYFADSQNSEENIVLKGNETAYLITGYSPNGSSFKINKCTGYLGQFQSWNPYLPYSCPAPRNENLSSIPKTVNNDACLDYIDYMPSCKIQTDNLPANWSYECTNFIYTKINYPSCVNTHKNDKDFFVGDWRVYLKRNATVWKDRRESIILIDNEGKIVSRFTY